MFAMTAETINKSVSTLLHPIRSFNGITLEYVGRVADTQFASAKSVSDLALNQMTAIVLVKQPQDMPDLGTHSFKTGVAFNQAVFTNTQKMMKMGYQYQGDVNRLLFPLNYIGGISNAPEHAKTVVKTIKTANSKTAKKSQTIQVVERSAVRLVSDRADKLSGESLNQEPLIQETNLESADSQNLNSGNVVEPKKMLEKHPAVGETPSKKSIDKNKAATKESIKNESLKKDSKEPELTP